MKADEVFLYTMSGIAVAGIVSSLAAMGVALYQLGNAVGW